MSSYAVASPPSDTAEEHGKTLARNAVFLLLGQIGSTTLSIALSAALGRRLGATDFGVYFLLLTMSTFAYVFVEWGQSAYLIREVAQRPQSSSTLVGSALLFRLLGAFGAVLLTAVIARLLNYEEPRIQTLAPLMVICSLPLALSQPFSYLFRARDRMDLDAIVTVVAKGLTVAATLPVLFMGGRLVGVILALGLGGIGALLTAVLLARRVGITRPQPTRAGMRELYVGGGSLAIFLVAIAIQPFLDAVVIGKLAPASAVGWYAAAKNIMGVLTAPATILAAAAFPQMCRAANDIPQLRKAVATAFQLLVGLGALAAVGTFLFADFAVTVIFDRAKFGPSVQVLQLFAPSMLLLFVDMLFGTVLTAVGRARELAWAKVLSVVVSTGLGAILVPMFQERVGNGGLGIVLAFGVSEFVMLGACLWMLPRGVVGRDSLLDLGRAVAAGVLTLGLFRLAMPFLNPWLALVGCVGTFGMLAWTLGLANPAALAQVLTPIRRRLP